MVSLGAHVAELRQTGPIERVQFLGHIAAFLWRLEAGLAAERLRLRLAKEEAVEHERGPSAHITNNNQHNGQQIDDLVLVSETNPVRLARLKLGENPVEFYEN